MNSSVHELLAAQRSVSSGADLARLGLSPSAADRLVRDGELVRVRRGAFVGAAAWNSAPPWERHQLRARAVARLKIDSATSPYALSHHSALSVLGIGMHGVDDRVHLVRTDGRRGNSGDVSQVHPPVPETQVRKVDGIRVVIPELAVLQVACSFGVEAGLVSVDSGLRRDAFTREDLQAASPFAGGRLGRSPARVVIQHADERRESAGESRTWWLCRTLGLPEPKLQEWITDPVTGVALGRVDFLFEAERTILEFDGMDKYDGLGALRAEKVREDRLRDLQYEVVRVTWAELAHPQRVRAKILAAFARAAARTVSVRR